MRLLIQRVSAASVTIDGEVTSSIGQGLLLFVGIEDADEDEDISFLCKRCVHLRIFDDENGVMNRSVLETKGAIMVVSQFTLHASTRKGNRPSYIRAAKTEIAEPLYEQFCCTLTEWLQRPVQTGIFGADMKVQLVNDGPVTIWIDSKNRE